MHIIDLTDFVLIGVILIQVSVLARLWYIVKDLNKYSADKYMRLDKRIDDISVRCWENDKKISGVDEVVRYLSSGVDNPYLK